MNNAVEKYFAAVREQMAAIEQSQRQNIETTAGWVSSALLNDHFIYAFGSGHSHTLVEEVFYRAGGLARVIPILDSRLMVHECASASTDWERKEGYAAEILSRYPLAAGDVLFIISNSGRNPVPIEMAMEAAKRGAKVIAISSFQYSGAYPSRHSSGKKLADVADLVINNCGVAGDAAVQVSGLRVGPTSTITSAFILNSILVEAVARVVAAGGHPEIWGSANSDTTNNAALLAKYKGVIPHL